MAQTLPPIGAEVPQMADGLPPIGAEVSEQKPDFHIDVKADQSQLSMLDQLLGFLRESTASINPANINRSVQSAFYHPIETAKGMLAGRQALSDRAMQAYRDGDYVTAGAKGLEWLIPFLGERMSESGDMLQRGEYGAGLGASVDAAGQLVAPELVRRGTGAVEGAMASRAEKLRASSAQDVQQALNPTRHRTKVQTQRITPGIQERGLVGNLEDLKTLAGQKVDEVGPQIDAILQANKGERVNLAPVRARVAKLRAETLNEVPARRGGRPVTDAATGQPVTEAAVHNPRKFAQVQAIENLLAKYGDDMSVEQAVAVRQTWDDVIKLAGGFDEKAGRGAFGVGLADASEAAVKKSVVGPLRTELAKAVPDVQALNKEYGFWRDLEDVATASASRKTGQHKTGLLGKSVENTGRAIGGYVGYRTGGAIGAGTGMLVGGETAKRLTALFHSPKWKLTSSKLKMNLADALASRKPDRIGQAIAEISRAQPVVQGAARESAGAAYPRAAERDAANR